MRIINQRLDNLQQQGFHFIYGCKPVQIRFRHRSNAHNGTILGIVLGWLRLAQLAFARGNSSQSPSSNGAIGTPSEAIGAFY